MAISFRLVRAVLALGLVLSLAIVATWGSGRGHAQVVVNPDVRVPRTTIIRELTLEVDPFGGEFTQWLSTTQFSDYTGSYSFRWMLLGTPYQEGEYIVRDQYDNVLVREPLAMAARQSGFFTLRLSELPQRPAYKVQVQGLANGQPVGNPSSIVTLTYAENEPVPFLFAPMNMQNFIDDRGVPGMSAAVSCSASTFFEWHAGMRRVDSTVKVQPNDLWHIGSNTKAMTAVMIAKLIEEGHFDWDTTVWDLVYDKRLLPGRQAGPFPMLFPSINAHFKDVTVEKLAAHRSGIVMSKGIDNPTREKSGYEQDPIAFRKDRIERLLKSSQGGTVGEWRYGHGNYMILGHLIERVRGKPYEQVMREELFAPLGMTTATFGMPTDVALGDPVQLPFSGLPSGDPWRDQFSTALNVDTLQAVNGHVFDPEKPEGQRVIKNNLALPPVWNPAGGAYMSSKDYLKFTRLLIDGRVGAFTLNSSSLAMLRSPYMQPDRQEGPPDIAADDREDPWYGGGWAQSADGSWGQVLSHDGSYGRFYTTANVYVDGGFSVVATTNVQGGRNDDGPDYPGDNAAGVARNWLIGQAKRFCSDIANRGSLLPKVGEPVPVLRRRLRETVDGRIVPPEPVQERRAIELPPLSEASGDFDVREPRPEQP